jgi:hypothetical protein
MTGKRSGGPELPSRGRLRRKNPGRIPGLKAWRNTDDIRRSALPAVGPAPRGSAQLGNGQQDRGVLQRLETVPGVRDDEQVSGACLPRLPTDDHADSAVEHLDGGRARVLMLSEAGTLAQADDGLA